MGVGKEIGRGLFGLAGRVVKIGTDIVGDAVGSKFIKEVGDTAEKVSTRSGELLGQAVDGVANVAGGIAAGDAKRIEEGLKESGSAVQDTAKGVGRAAGQAVADAGTVVSGLSNGDAEAVKTGIRGLAKTGAIAVLSVGVLDALDIVDIGAEGIGEGAAAASLPVGELGPIAGDPGTHFVAPHEVSEYTRADGTEVGSYWRDGDGDTSIDRTVSEGGGYLRSNPDGDPSNNLNS